MRNSTENVVNSLLKKGYSAKNKNRFVNEIKKDIPVDYQPVFNNQLNLLYTDLKICRDLINRISKNNEIEKDRLSKSKSLFAVAGLEIPKKYLEEIKYGI